MVYQNCQWFLRRGTAGIVAHALHEQRGCSRGGLSENQCLGLPLCCFSAFSSQRLPLNEPWESRVELTSSSNAIMVLLRKESSALVASCILIYKTARDFLGTDFAEMDDSLKGVFLPTPDFTLNL